MDIYDGLNVISGISRQRIELCHPPAAGNQAAGRRLQEGVVSLLVSAMSLLAGVCLCLPVITLIGRLARHAAPFLWW